MDFEKVTDNVVKLLTLLVLFSAAFLSDIYDYFTEPDVHFIYGTYYEKNPVTELNRRIKMFQEQLIGQDNVDIKDVSKPFLREISKQLIGSMPLILSSMDHKPLDTMMVQIINLSRHNLENIRVHFIGCEGYDSYTTFPDGVGSEENRNLKPGDWPVTIRYNKILGGNDDLYSSARVMFHGEDASNCEPVVDAELSNGKNANGEFRRNWEAERSGEWLWIFELVWKVILVLLLSYLIWQIRLLRRRTR